MLFAIDGQPRKQDMSEDDDNADSGDVQHISRVLGELAKAIVAETVVVKLQNGREIVGPIEGISIRKKTSKKGDVNWSGNIRIQTDPGVLEIDCLTIDLLSPK
jgi:hypothetical protein